MLLLALAAYLALLFDLIPDFIPVAGSGGEDLIRELWPGPERSLALIPRLAA